MIESNVLLLEFDQVLEFLSDLPNGAYFDTYAIIMLGNNHKKQWK